MLARVVESIVTQPLENVPASFEQSVGQERHGSAGDFTCKFHAVSSFIVGGRPYTTMRSRTIEGARICDTGKIATERNGGGSGWGEWSLTPLASRLDIHPRDYQTLVFCQTIQQMQRFATRALLKVQTRNRHNLPQQRVRGGEIVCGVCSLNLKTRTSPPEEYCSTSGCGACVCRPAEQMCPRRGRFAGDSR